MKILALDTATEACSAALMVDDDICGRYQVAPRQHAELILAMVDGLLAEAELSLGQLDCLAFGRGPGAFTGVRVATGVTQGLAYAADLPVAAVSSLAILAQSVAAHHPYIIPAFDARMGEVYIAEYEVNSEGLALLRGEEQVIKPELLTRQNTSAAFGLGSGWQTYANILREKYAGHSFAQDPRFPDAKNALPHALALLKQGHCVSAAEVRPVYLRNKVTF